MRPATGMNRTIIASLVLFLALTGCKKDNDQKETGGSQSPVSVLSAPAEITQQEELQTLPSGAMKGLSVHTIPAQPKSAPLPDMIAMAGTDMSVRMSQRMRTTPGWVQDFPDIYKPLHDCLEQADGGAAYATQAVINSVRMNAVIVGLDNNVYECQINMGGSDTASLKQSDEPVPQDILFYPRASGRPFTDNPQCFEMEAVVARPGGLIGWLAYPKATCIMAEQNQP